VPGFSASDEPNAKAFSTAIDRFNSLDPQSPDTLQTRLAYADFLARAVGGDCLTRLDAAQTQLDAARETPAIGVALPTGLARAADVEYQIRLARASCGDRGQARGAELRAAIEAARRAADLYRDALDYPSMVTMQFNVGVAYHTLGDDRAALAALNTTIGLDREFGFRDDAQDNYRLLLQWNNQKDGPDEIAALMKDFPQRSTTLRFGWVAGDEDLTLATDYSLVVGNQILRDRGVRAVRREVRKHPFRWVVSYQSAAAQYQLDSQPPDDGLLQGLVVSMGRMLLRLHDVGLGSKGDFREALNVGSFAARVRADVGALTHGLASKVEHSPKLTRRIDEVVNIARSPQAIAAMVDEDYNLETETWVGATLEQGVWYDMLGAAPTERPAPINIA
jgi:tetratricopeptide (TPR) repeat protein